MKIRNINSRSLHVSFTIILGLFFIGSLRAQEKASEKEKVALHLVAKPYVDSIVLRWVPVNSAVWEATKEDGFMIKRYQLFDGNKGILDTIARHIRPMDEKDMVEKYPDNKYVGIIQTTVYGEKFHYKNTKPINLIDSAIQGQKQLNTRFFLAMFASSLSTEAADAAGLRFVDKNVVPGGKYVYIISTTAKSEQYIIDSGVVATVNVKFPENPPTGLNAISGDKQIELHWDRNQVQNFDAFDIERSDDGGKTFTLLNKTPFFSPYDISSDAKDDSTTMIANSLLSQFQIFIDSIPENYKDYYYRIRGYDGFGSVGEYSETIVAHGIDLKPPAPPAFDSIINTAPHTFKLYWTPNTADKDLDGYFILRATRLDGDYQSITPQKLSKGTNSFTDTAAVEGHNNFYIMVAVDTAKNTAQTPPQMAVFIDSIPPVKPKGLKGIIDSTGIVQLSWDPNPDPDIKGYKVYYSYSPTGVFSQANGYTVAETSYQDTLSMKIINRKVFYKIKAIDHNANASEFSDVAVLDKPILFAPTSPVPKSIYLKDSKIVSEWYASASSGVVGYEVYRQENGKEAIPLAKITEMPHTDFTFTDSNFSFNTEYTYSAVAIDSSGLESQLSFSLSISYNKTDILPGIRQIQASFDEKAKSVKIDWETIEMKENDFIIIYRAEGDGPLNLYRSVDRNTHQFLDYKIKKGTTYRYAIRIKRSKEVLESQLSTEQLVKIP